MKSYFYTIGTATGLTSAENLFKWFGVDAAWLNANVHGGKIGNTTKGEFKVKIIEA